MTDHDDRNDLTPDGLPSTAQMGGSELDGVVSDNKGQSSFSPGVSASSDRTGAADDAFLFDDLVVAHGSEFGQSPVFDEMDHEDQPFEDGTCGFQLERSTLLSMLDVVGFTLASGGDRAHVVQLQLTESSLAIRGFGPPGAVEAVGGLFRPPAKIPKDLVLQAWVVAYSELVKTAEAAGSVVRVVYRADPTPTLMIESEGFERPLLIEPAKSFIDHSRVDFGALNSQPGFSLQPDQLRGALAFVGRHAERDDITREFDLVEIRNGHVVGGTRQAVAFASSSSFKGLAVKVPVKCLSVLDAVLAHAGQNEVTFQDVKDHHVVRSSNVNYAFPTTNASFPAVAEEFLALPRKERLITSRAGLATRLAALRSAFDPPCDRVQLEVRGSAIKSRLTFRTRSDDGRELSYRTKATIMDTDRFPVAAIALKNLIQVITAGQSINVAFQAINNSQAILVEGDDLKFEGYVFFQNGAVNKTKNAKR